MPAFLILRLHGPMQAWGKHTFETFRPSELFPTRSGVVGLLAACLGIERCQKEDLRALSDAFAFAVRVDHDPRCPLRRITDFHTIKDARGVRLGKSKDQEISRREYLCDARFTVAMQFAPGAEYELARVRDALRRPHFTPFLGRRSCPLTRPLLASDIGTDGEIEAADGLAALALVPPGRGTVYGEAPWPSGNRLVVRDVPLFGGERQFTTRPVFIHAREPADVSVPQQD